MYVPTLLFVVAFLYNYNVALHAQNHERCGEVKKKEARAPEWMKKNDKKKSKGNEKCTVQNLHETTNNIWIQ